MKLKKMMIAILGSILSVIMGASVASAVWCSSGVITEISLFPDKANETTSMYAVKLDCEDSEWDEAEAAAGGPIQFLFIKDIGVAGYTSALTAMAADKKVSMVVSAATWSSLATRIKILSPVE